MKKRTKIIISILVVLFLLIGIVAGALIYINSALKPTRAFLKGEICEDGSIGCETTPFIVDEGAYGKSTLEKLESMNIIKDADVVYYYNRIMTGYAFSAGYFEIPHQMTDEFGNIHNITLDELLAFLADPRNAHQDTVTLSFDEGDFVRSFAKTIGEYTTVKEEELLEYWNDEDVVRSYMKEYPFLTEDIFNEETKYYLEGYLFPDTYEFFEFTNCDEVTRKFLNRTLEIYEKYADDFNETDFSIHEVFTLASIVQWETGNIDDAPKVAGVFVNRMNDYIVLGSTVTACYAFDLTKDECHAHGDELRYTQTYHPYNTYTIQGLPPGPICCPNETSINAALNPDTSDGYYFFCANWCEGGTVFARTEAEHNYNVQTYMLACEPY